MDPALRSASKAVLAALLAALLMVSLFAAEAAAKAPAKPRSTDPSPLVHEATKANTLGLVAAGTGITIANDIASVLSYGQETGPSGEELRIVAISGRGGEQNVRDLLFVRGVDLAIASTNQLERLRGDPDLRDLDRKVVYITKLFNEEIHILARPEIRDLSDLAGKPVNLGQFGSGTEDMTREMFKVLGVPVQEMNLTQMDALDRMRRGELAADVTIAGKPVPVLAGVRREDGFHLLPVPYGRGFEKGYLPASIGQEDYPNLFPQGGSVDTIAVGALLLAFDWPTGSDRRRALEGFVDLFFSRIAEFKVPPHHPKWRETNIAAVVEGWRRFDPAERWIRQALQEKGTGVETGGLRLDFDRYLGETGSAGEMSPQRQEQLFRDFLQWRERQRSQ
jgi:uncharacterized protein